MSNDFFLPWMMASRNSAHAKINLLPFSVTFFWTHERTCEMQYSINIHVAGTMNISKTDMYRFITNLTMNITVTSSVSSRIGTNK